MSRSARGVQVWVSGHSLGVLVAGLAVLLVGMLSFAPLAFGTSSAPIFNLKHPEAAELYALNPTLTVAVVDAEADAVSFRFEVSDSSDFSTNLRDSGWRTPVGGAGTTRGESWVVQPALPEPASGRKQWFWRALARDDATDTEPCQPVGASASQCVTTFTGMIGSTVQPDSFVLDRRMLGASDAPTVDVVGTTVNEVTGNLDVSAPSALYPGAATSLGLGLTFNSQYTGADQGLGVGWTLGVGPGGSMPVRVTEPSGGATAGLVSVEMDDGSVNSFVAAENLPSAPISYTPINGDLGGQLDKNADGSMTLRSGTGAIFTFGIGSGGSHALEGAVVPLGNRNANGASPPVGSTLAYAFAGNRPTGVSDGFRSLVLAWFGGACDVALCVTQHTGDLGNSGGSTDSVVWKYALDANGKLGSVRRVEGAKARTLASYSYDAAGRLVAIKNANDLNLPNDPAVARSPGYNAAHEVQIGYDTSAPPRVVRLEEINLSGQVGGTNRKWTISYSSGGILASPLSHPTAGRGVPTGTTGVCVPRQQPGCASLVSVIYDEFGRILQQNDERATPVRVDLSQFDDQGRLLWAEDTVGASVDNTWDTNRNELLQTTGPDPDGTGPRARPIAVKRYDEAAPATASTTTDPLAGLVAEYFSNSQLSGLPTTVRVQNALDSSNFANLANGSYSLAWGATGPAELNGQLTNFSARYSGFVDATAKRLVGGVEVPAIWRFAEASDDGMRLYVDGKLLLDKWNASGCVDTNPCLQEVAILSGYHRIVVEFQQLDLTAGVRFAFGCLDCTTSGDGLSAFQPSLGNLTSSISPTGKYGYTHFSAPERGLSDYDLVRAPSSGESGTPDLVSFRSYDALGRISTTVMPKGMSSCKPATADGTGYAKGDLRDAATPSNACNPNLTHGTQFTYYGQAETTPASPPCAAALGVVQAGLLKKREANPAASDTAVAPESFVYDGAGRIVAATRAAGATCLLYNDEGLLASQQAPGETVSTRRTFTYDPNGATRQVTGISRLCPPPHSSCTGSSATIGLEYDEAGRLVKSTGANAGNQSSFVYDQSNNVTSRRDYPAAFGGGNTLYTTSYLYNAADEVTQATDANGKVFLHGYDKRGIHTWQRYANGTFSWDSTDFAGEATGQFNRACPGTLANCANDLTTALTSTAGQNNSALATPPATSAIVDTTQAFDDDGSITQTVRSGSGGLSTQTTGFTYDAGARLSQANLTSTTPSENGTWAYTYDRDSNRATEIAGGTTTTYTYDASKTPGVDQLTQTTSGAITKCFAYDADERETLKGTWSGATCSGSGTSTNERVGYWDGRDRHYDGQYASTFVGRSFDPLDREAERHVNSTSTHTRFYSYAGMDDSPVFETDINGVIKQSYIPDAPIRYTCDYLANSTCSARPTTGTPEYLYSNPHGDVVATANDAGSRTASYTYEPFGKPRQTATAVEANLARDRWLGDFKRRYDNNSQLIEMGARPYDATSGRFLAKDPSQGGSCNDYDYACADPVNEMDLTGTNVRCCDGGGGGPRAGGTRAAASGSAGDTPTRGGTSARPASRASTRPTGAPRSAAAEVRIPTTYARQAAVKKAWAAERRLILEGKPGTREWTKEERAEIALTGKARGYEGHHINSVSGFPEVAGDPNNVIFLTRAEHLIAHGGNWRIVTTGRLVNRGD